MAMRGRGGFFRGGTRRSGPQAPADPKTLLTATGTTAYAWDLATDALAWGPNAAEVLGLPHRDILPTGEAFAQAIEPESGAGRAEAIQASDETDQGEGVAYRTRYALRIKADRLVMVEDTGRWYADAEGRPAHARGTLRVDTNPAGSQMLTASLRARAALLAQIVNDVVEAQRSQHAVTLIVGAVAPGEQDADIVMAEIARRIRPLMRRRDRFVPYALNRFALALTSCPAADAEIAAKRFLSLIEAEPGPDPVVQDLRLGAAIAPDHALDAPELLRRAEEALTVAAGSGESRIAVYRAGTVRAGMSIHGGTSAADIVDALNDRRLLLACRPVIDAQTRNLVFQEAVIRLKSAADRVTVAGDIGPAAKRAELATLVDARLLELTADHLARHRDARMAIPVSPSTLQNSEWLTMLAAHLGARPGIESRLIVELPEAALSEMQAARGRIDAMKALGVGIALAGFGTGHLSLKQIRSLAIDILKIDGALIQSLSRSTDDRHLVRSLIDLAHHLGIATIAEWVEDEPTARLLAGWGVDYLQGPFCGMPVLAAERPEPKGRRAGAA
jgi:EAL domain-containing protein (putative c-di-GMP-specific phosphodiesterase class I)